MSDTKESNYEFPSDFTDPLEKEGKTFGLQAARAIWRSYRNANGFVGFNARSSYAELLSLAQGRQSVENLRKTLGIQPQGSEVQGVSYIDPQVLNLAPKFVNLVQGKLSKINYDIEVTAIDPASVDYQKQFKNQVKAFYKLRDWLQEIKAPAQKLFPMIDVAEMPTEPDEFIIESQSNYKIKEGVQHELFLKEQFEKENWQQIKRDLSFDWIVYGIGFGRVFVDENGKYRVEKYHPKSLVTSTSSKENFEDIWYAGNLELITKGQFIKETSGDLSLTEQENIIKDHAKTSQSEYDTDINTFDSNYDGGEYISVLRFQMLSTNTENYVMSNDKFGNIKTEKKRHDFKIAEFDKPNYDSGKKKLVTNESVYKYGGTYVVNSNCVYGYGSMMSEREFGDDCNTKLDYFIHAPNMHDQRIVSLIAQIKEPILMVNVAWNKIKEILAKGYMGILEINFSEIAEITMGEGGKAWTPTQVMKLFFQNQIGIKNGKVNEFDQSYGKAFEIQNSGLTITDYWNTISGSLEQIRQITGINENSDGSTPKTNTLNGVMEMANESTNTSLDYLYHALHSTYKTVAKNLLLKRQAMETDGEPLNNFVIGLHKRPTDIELGELFQEIAKYAAIPLDQGGLTAADSFEIKEAAKINIKNANQIMAARVKKNMRTAQVNQQANQQQQIEGQMQQAQQAQQAEQARLQFAAQIEMQINQQKHGFEMELQQLKNEGLVAGRELDYHKTVYQSDKGYETGTHREYIRNEGNNDKQGLKNQAEISKAILTESNKENLEHIKNEGKKEVAKKKEPTTK